MYKEQLYVHRPSIDDVLCGVEKSSFSRTKGNIAEALVASWLSNIPGIQLIDESTDFGIYSIGYEGKKPTIFRTKKRRGVQRANAYMKPDFAYVIDGVPYFIEVKSRELNSLPDQVDKLAKAAGKKAKVLAIAPRETFQDLQWIEERHRGTFTYLDIGYDWQDLDRVMESYFNFRIPGKTYGNNQPKQLALNPI